MAPAPTRPGGLGRTPVDGLLGERIEVLLPSACDLPALGIARARHEHRRFREHDIAQLLYVRVVGVGVENRVCKSGRLAWAMTATMSHPNADGPGADVLDVPICVLCLAEAQARSGVADGEAKASEIVSHGCFG
jgi:hypothetical protein